MRVPDRYIAKKKADPEKEPANHNDDSGEILNEIKRLMPKKQQPTAYSFKIIRDQNGLMTEVIATPIDTII